MGELTFVDEPPPYRTGPKGRFLRAHTRARIDELMAHPGQWAEWPSGVSPSQLKKTLKGIGEFEIVGRGIHGRPRAFVRYIGPSAPDNVTPLRPETAATRPAEPPAPTPLHPAATPAAGPKAEKPVAAGKVACPACGDAITPRTGELRSQTLERHSKDRPLCAAIIRRRTR